MICLENLSRLVMQYLKMVIGCYKLTNINFDILVKLCKMKIANYCKSLVILFKLSYFLKGIHIDFSFDIIQ